MPGRHRGPALPRLPLRAGRDLARPRPPGGGRGRRRARPAPCSTCPTCSATRSGPEVAVTLDRLIGGGRAGRGQVFFGNSGAEANECALKLARRWAGPGRYAVVSTWDSFHGRTLATLPATGQPAKHAAFQPLPEGFGHVPYDDLDALDAACDPARVAAVLVEPIKGEGGVVVPSSDYLAGLRQLCTDRDILLMVDEVQTGLGRTGRWFGFQHLGIEPDVVTMAKALGNGMPVGACWARAEVAAAFVPGDHGSTFGGQPLAMSAARATLAVMEAEDVPARAAPGRGPPAAGPRRRCPGWPSVRGAGLLLAAELTRRCAVAGGGRRPSTAGLIVNARSRRPPVRPVAAGARRRDRPGALGRSWPRCWQRPWWRRGDPATEVAAVTGTATRHLLDIDDLGRRAGRGAGPGRAPTRPTAPGPGRAGRGPGLREAVQPHPQRHGDGRGGPRAATRSTSRAHEVGLDVRETAADVARTLACYHAVLCARVFDHGSLERMAAAPRRGGVRSRWSTCCPTRPTPARPWPTCSPCARCSATRLAGRPDGGLCGRRQQRVAVAGPGRARWPGIAVRVAAPAATAPRRPTVDAGRARFGGRLTGDRRPGRGGGRGRRRLHRRVDLDGPGGRGRRPGGPPSPASPSTTPLMAGGRPGRRVPALPARPPGRGDHRRGGRRSPEPGLAAGRQPHARHARPAGLGPGTGRWRRSREGRPSTSASTGSPSCSRPRRWATRPSWSSCWPPRASRPPRPPCPATSRSWAPSRCGCPAATPPTPCPSCPPSRWRPRTTCAGCWGTGWWRSPTRATWWCCAPRPARPTWWPRPSTAAGLAGLIGTVAGDDTVLVVAAEAVGRPPAGRAGWAGLAGLQPAGPDDRPHRPGRTGDRTAWIADRPRLPTANADDRKE